MTDRQRLRTTPQHPKLRHHLPHRTGLTRHHHSRRTVDRRHTHPGPPRQQPP
ncbi:hypothetical protein LV779_18985 [Streptomyces thinghirensis]|nr:hypothetical protein [Streptomyces thinghirensis]